jgi:DNA-binding transcriptional MocR family regulator
MAWELDADRPIYAQLVERIQKEIVSGKYQPGEKLPSVRDLLSVLKIVSFQLIKYLIAESFCRTGAERPDRDTAHQRQNRDGGH